MRSAHLQVCQPHVRLEAMEAPSSASMPELMPSHIAHIAYVVMSKLTTRQLILTLFPAFFLILVLHMYAELVTTELADRSNVGTDLGVAVACGLVVFSFNTVIAVFSPGELVHDLKATWVPITLFFVCTLIAVVKDMAYHSELRSSTQAESRYVGLHLVAAICCLAVQLLNVGLLATARLTWSGLRWTQALDGLVTFVAQVTACAHFKIGLLGALGRTVPPLIAASLMTRDNRFWLAAQAQRMGVYHVRVNLTELPAGALALSQHAACSRLEEYDAHDEDTSSSSSYGTDDQAESHHSHHTAKMDITFLAADMPLEKGTQAEAPGAPAPAAAPDACGVAPYMPLEKGTQAPRAPAPAAAPHAFGVGSFSSRSCQQRRL